MKIQDCVSGVQIALSKKNYESAANFIGKYYKIDPSLLEGF